MNEKLINDVKLLEDPELKKALSLLDLAAFNSKVSKNRKICADIKDAQNMTDKTNIKALSAYELQQEMKRFNLVLVKSNYYKGSYNKDYLKKLTAFLEDEKASIISSEYEIKNNMFFLYPFNPIVLLYKQYREGKSNPNYLIYDDQIYFNTGYFIKNPTLLFCYNEQFYVIEKGTSYNKFNAIIGFLTKSRFNCILTYILTGISLALLLTLSKPNFVLGVSLLGGIGVFMLALFSIITDQIYYNKSFKKLYNGN